MSGSSIKNLRLFRKLCGNENMGNVTLVTTWWDKVTLEEGERRERELRQPGGFWSTMLANGSSIVRYDGTAQCANDLVLSMVKNSPMLIKLQREMAAGKSLIDTEAGASINEEILKLQKKHKEELDELKEEMDIAMKQGILHSVPNIRTQTLRNI
jgi:hypothetical protein